MNAEADPNCPVCQGKGEYMEEVNVSWITIKAIYAKIVDHSTAS